MTTFTCLALPHLLSRMQGFRWSSRPHTFPLPPSCKSKWVSPVLSDLGKDMDEADASYKCHGRGGLPPLESACKSPLLTNLKAPLDKFAETTLGRV